MFFKKDNLDFFVVCLGNVGEKYNFTRHNVGFIFSDYFSQKMNVKIDKKKFNSLYTILDFDGKKVLIIKPLTFMNLSGEATLKFIEYYKISLDKLIVIYDDISLDVGNIRIRRKGSHGGQNGVRNIIDCINSDVFKRIKIGVSNKPTKEYDLASWVLSKFSDDEIDNLNSSLDKAFNALKLIFNDKIDEAMNKFN